jgi:benzaldehyde dehydrogenase (NAD)
MRTQQSRSVLEQEAWRERIFGGSWQTPRGGAADVREPATGRTLTRTGVANAEDVATAARQAAAAQPKWAATPPRDRADLFRRAASFLAENLDPFAAYVARETGGILPKGQHELREAIFMLHAAAATVLAPQGLVLPSTPGRMNYAKRVAHGVVGVISPSNFPMILSMRSVAPALAMGNAVLLKPDPQTPVSGGFLIALAFESAGLPEGVLQVLPGGAEAGEAICVDPRIQMIAFTGSTGAGRRVGELAGKHLKKLALELGGKNSLIVLEDADLDRAASNVAWGAYFHQGQVCMATGRVLVQRSVAAELTRRVAEKARRLPVGDPAQEQVPIGPLMNEQQRDRVHGIVEEALREGATLEAGGTYERLFYKPTVLSAVRPSMRAFREEIFGPVACIAAFDGDDEAVELANNTEYGLSAGIISPSLGRAMAIGERLQSGLVHVNDQTINDEVVNPFGGRGASGNGTSMGGPSDMDAYSQWRWVTVKSEAPAYPF